MTAGRTRILLFEESTAWETLGHPELVGLSEPGPRRGTQDGGASGGRGGTARRVVAPPHLVQRIPAGAGRAPRQVRAPGAAEPRRHHREQAHNLPAAPRQRQRGQAGGLAARVGVQAQRRAAKGAQHRAGAAGRERVPVPPGLLRRPAGVRGGGVVPSLPEHTDARHARRGQPAAGVPRRAGLEPGGHAHRLHPGGCRPDGRAHAPLHCERRRRRRDRRRAGPGRAVPAVPLPARGLRRLLLPGQPGPLRAVAQAARAAPEPGQVRGRLLRAARARLRGAAPHARRPRVAARRGRRRGGGPAPRRQRGRRGGTVARECA